MARFFILVLFVAALASIISAAPQAFPESKNCRIIHNLDRIVHQAAWKSLDRIPTSKKEVASEVMKAKNAWTAVDEIRKQHKASKNVEKINDYRAQIGQALETLATKYKGSDVGDKAKASIEHMEVATYGRLLFRDECKR